MSAFTSNLQVLLNWVSPPSSSMDHCLGFGRCSRVFGGSKLCEDLFTSAPQTLSCWQSEVFQSRCQEQTQMIIPSVAEHNEARLQLYASPCQEKEISPLNCFFEMASPSQWLSLKPRPPPRTSYRGSCIPHYRTPQSLPSIELL